MTPGDDPFDALVAGGLERPDDDPAVVRLQDDAGAPDFELLAALAGPRRRSSWSGSRQSGGLE